MRVRQVIISWIVPHGLTMCTNKLYSRVLSLLVPAICRIWKLNSAIILEHLLLWFDDWFHCSTLSCFRVMVTLLEAVDAESTANYVIQRARIVISVGLQITCLSDFWYNWVVVHFVTIIFCMIWYLQLTAKWNTVKKYLHDLTLSHCVISSCW